MGWELRGREWWFDGVRSRGPGFGAACWLSLDLGGRIGRGTSTGTRTSFGLRRNLRVEAVAEAEPSLKIIGLVEKRGVDRDGGDRRVWAYEYRAWHCLGDRDRSSSRSRARSSASGRVVLDGR